MIFWIVSKLLYFTFLFEMRKTLFMDKVYQPQLYETTRMKQLTFITIVQGLFQLQNDEWLS